MRVGRARIQDREYWGEILGDQFVPISTNCLEDLMGKRGLRRLMSVPLSEATLLAPAPTPKKLICIGLNYRDHCEEQNIPIPTKPVVFAKFPSAISGPLDTVDYPLETSQLDFEVELAVVIGSPGRSITPSAAMDHVFGYTVFNDLSARDVQFADGQWTRGKSFPGFGPMGPWIVTADELPDPQNLDLDLSVNGVFLQRSNTRHMIFGVAEIISYVSQLGLEAGDVIATGTPAGCGAFRDPQVFLRPGDTVIASVTGIGSLRNSIVDVRAAVGGPDRKEPNA